MAAFNLTIEDCSPLVTYSPSGAWQDSALEDPFLTSYSGQNYHRTNVEGATATIDFHGTGITLFGGRRPGYGGFTVSVDGQIITNGDASGSADAARQTLATVSGLSLGNHRAVLTNAGGSQIDIDSVTIEDQIGPQGSQVRVQNFDDDSPAFTYLPSPSVWNINRQDKFQGGTLHYTNATDAAVSMQFSGDAVALYGTMSPDHTGMKVTIDGSDVSLSSGTSHVSRLHTKVLLYFRNGLGAGQHTLVLSSESPSPDAPFIDIDAVAVLSAVSSSSDPTPSGVQGFPGTTSRALPGSSSTPSDAFDSTASSASSRASGGLSKGAIAGIAVGAAIGLIAFLAICFIVLFLGRRRRNANTSGVPRPGSPISPDLPMQQDPKRIEAGMISGPLENPVFVFPPKGPQVPVLNNPRHSLAHSIAPSYYGSPLSGKASLATSSSQSPLIPRVRLETPTPPSMSPRTSPRKAPPPVPPMPDHFVTTSIAERLTRSPPRPSPRRELADYNQMRI